MSFIGRTHGKIGDKEYPTIDYLEQPGKLVENTRDNLFSPLVLAILCKKQHTFNTLEQDVYLHTTMNIHSQMKQRVLMKMIYLILLVPDILQ